MVLVGSEEGAKATTMSLRDALDAAKNAGLDLVEVASHDSGVPICRIIDYGKFKYEKGRKLRQLRRSSTISAQMREVRMTAVISDNDLRSKTRRVTEFLTNSIKVKVSVILKGRMIIRPEFAMEILNKMYKSVEDVGQIEKPPTVAGRTITMVIGPKSRKKNVESQTESEAENGVADGAESQVETELKNEVENQSEV